MEHSTASSPCRSPFAPTGARGRFRCQATDFQVVEVLDFVPGGGGEHLWLKVRKTGTNTDWLARQLAAWAGVSPSAVGYAGLKDRHAVTEQWFSLHLPGRPDPATALDLDGVEIVHSVRHPRKLHRGDHTGNHFVIVLRQLHGERTLIDARLQELADAGLPNGFGAQRFGHRGDNLGHARDWLAGRKQVRDRQLRSIYLSAARSHLFNRVLDARIDAGCWNQPIDGDALIPFQGRGLTVHDPAQPDAPPGFLASGPLCGAGPAPCRRAALALEQTTLADEQTLIEQLAAAGLRHERRPLYVRPEDLHGHWLADDVLQVSFALPAGCYATVLLDCLAELEDAAGHDSSTTPT